MSRAGDTSLRRDLFKALRNFNSASHTNVYFVIAMQCRAVHPSGKPGGIILGVGSVSSNRFSGSLPFAVMPLEKETWPKLSIHRAEADLPSCEKRIFS